MADHTVSLDIDIAGTDSTIFDVTRTSPDETYVGLGELSLEDGKLTYEAPAGSVTTFVGQVPADTNRPVTGSGRLGFTQGET